MTSITKLFITIVPITILLIVLLMGNKDPVRELFIDGNTPIASASMDNASYSNLTGLTSTYIPSSTGVVVDASAYNKFIMLLETNLTMCSPTNALPGRSLQWSVLASGGNRSVTWPTNFFKIPTSSTMSNVVTVSNGTESIFVIEYRTNVPNWKLETYVWGY